MKNGVTIAQCREYYPENIIHSQSTLSAGA